MNLVNWTPVRDMEGFFDRYNNTMAPRARPGGEVGKAIDWRPSVDISETNKDYLIKVELPEVEKDGVQVTVDNGLLTISGERKYEKEDETETQHHVESMYGRFSRKFTLPADAEEMQISARSKNGVLKIRIPKTKATVEEPIKIAVE
ncbi:MAG: Hsp20/alpha crystallin family protein [Gammaproteobacteria bacterium]|jgi:HSP20 family protein|nr:Hsp20/alpha crystallin family protein [Gammaproteobacteria bacterium]MDH3805195.1 Hsp20/alpha crystallin family protein [Gammaproteobacteria bacterium]